MGVFVYHFSCGSEESARRLANAILVAGLRPRLRTPRLPDEVWVVLAAAELEPTAENLAELHQTMAEAAARAGARLDRREPEGPAPEPPG
jgi:hypothetical protein